MSATLERPYAQAVAAVRSALADQGFGILTEIDLRATLKAKLDVEVPPQVILGACRPQLAHQALPDVATDARQRLAAALSALTADSEEA